MALRVASLFDGVGGGILAAEAAGMHVVWRAEIDKWCNEVMAVRRPEIMNLGSVEDIDGRVAPAVDLLIGGFPCQNLSVAGGRAGLAGKQSGLWYEFERLIGEIRPRWVVIENVPGLRSSQQGRDLGIILGALEQFGYGWAMRSLDAQYAGLAQRRERVFIVGYSGAEWTAPAQVLFEPEGVLRDSPPGREARQEVAGTLGGGSGQRGWSIDLDRMTFVPCYWDGGQVSDTLDVSSLVKGQMMPEKRRFPVVFDREPALVEPVSVTGDIAHTLRSEGGDASEDGTGRGTPIIAFSSKDDGRDATEDISPTIRAMSHDGSHLNGGGQIAIALIQNATRGKDQNGLGISDSDSPMYTLDGASQHAVAVAYNIFGGNKRKDHPEGGSYTEENPDVTKSLDTAGLNPADQQGSFVVAFSENQRAEVVLSEYSHQLTSGGGKPGQGYPAVLIAPFDERVITSKTINERGLMSIIEWAREHLAVRRLTPLECERLQGYPDGWTAVTMSNGKPMSDSQRYRQLGNGFPVPVVTWIMKRIAAYESGEL
jgi:DNA (cytosine-5)-methyltransferase 1